MKTNNTPHTFMKGSVINPSNLHLSAFCVAVGTVWLVVCFYPDLWLECHYTNMTSYRMFWARSAPPCSTIPPFGAPVPCWASSRGVWGWPGACPPSPARPTVWSTRRDSGERTLTAATRPATPPAAPSASVSPHPIHRFVAP